MAYVFDPAGGVSVDVKGTADRFPVHRIYCVARNYAAHAREMGNDPDREPPFFFTKPADAIVANFGEIPYPPRTANLHHEIELVVALAGGGADLSPAAVSGLIFGYAVGNDLTRRDLQAQAKEAGRPWDTAKGFDHSAPLTAIHPIAMTGPIERGRIWLSVNGEMRQEADLADMIWPVAAIIAELSTLYELRPGDLIFTGTPAGVGPVVRGDLLEGSIAGLERLVNRVI
jgi:fumarylpyruvate hydrolase